MEEYRLRPGARARELLEGFLVEYVKYSLAENVLFFRNL